MAKPNLLYKVLAASWMIEPLTASAAYKLFADMVGAARLKSEHPIIEYDIDAEDDDFQADYYHYRLTHADYASIPDGKQVNVVRLEGVMMRDDGLCQPGTRQLAQWLADGDQDPRVVATILLTDSGGGASDSVKPLAEAISQCNKPVVAYCDGDMCSAAYYAAAYANHIMANDRRNRIGCIGTMVQITGYPANTKFEDGYAILRIYADNSDQKNLDYEQALEGDFKLIRENVLNPLAEDFRNDVKLLRPASSEEQRHGRTYYAQDVVGSLIDSIGTFEEAVNQAINTNQTISKMKGHENLQSLDTCRDLQMVEGYVSLNGEQLAEIDATLGEAATERALHETDAETIRKQSDTIAEQLTEINDLTSERDELKTKAEQLEAKEAEIASLTQERDTLREEAAQKDARIAELEAALDHNPENEEDPLPAMHNGNPAKPEDSWKEPTDEESAAYCRQVLKGEI